MKTHKSAFIFNLAEEFEIPLTLGKQSIMEDDDFLSFREKYLSLANERDINVISYLKDNPKLFRVYLPYSERVFNVASQITWYFDEIIVRDPIYGKLKDVQEDLENQKVQLRDLLQLLGQFKELINEGYMILSSHSSLSTVSHVIPDYTEEILSNQKIYDALTISAYCGYELRKNDDGIPMAVYQLLTDSGFIYGWNLVNVKGKKEIVSPSIEMGEKMKPISFIELRNKVKGLEDNRINEVFKREIHRSIRAYKISQELNSVVLFDRQLDSTIITEAKLLDTTNKQAKTVGSLNMILPYIQSIDTQKLVDLRNDMPDSFNDFRSYLVEIIKDDLSDPNLSQEEIDFITKNKIEPHMMHLEAELKNAIKRVRAMSGSITAITALGALTGYHLGVSPSFILALSTAGAMASLTPIDNLVKTKSNIKLNPLYFLWNASRK